MITKYPLEDLVEGIVDQYEGWEGVKQMEGTAERLTKMYQEFCWTQDHIDADLRRHTKLFEDDYQEVMTISNIVEISLCPHHFLPCRFRIEVTYAPKGKVLGLSKFPRIAVILAKRPTMQETYTKLLCQYLFDNTGAQGVRVKVRGVHGCLSYRGALQEAASVTTVMQRGVIPNEVCDRE